MFVNGHGSNTKVLDPLLRRIKYETGAFVALYKPYAERYIGLLEDLLENPPEETPGWHASELETSQVMAHDPRAGATWTARPRIARRCRRGCRTSFIKKDGAPDVEFDGYQYFVFPMDHGEFSRTGRDRQPDAGDARRRASRRSSASATTSSRRSTQFRPLPVQITQRAFEDRV